MFSFTIIEQDEDVVEFTVTGADGTLTVITGWRKEGDTLILDQLHLDGPGPGFFGPAGLLSIVRELGRQQGVRVVIIHGAVRTTGANPGHKPHAVRVVVE